MKRFATLLLLACGAALGGDPGFEEVFDPARHPEGQERTDRQHAAFERAVASKGVAAAIHAFRAFESALASLRDRMERGYATYRRLGAEWWAYRRKYEADYEKKHGRPPAEYPPPPNNRAFLESELAFRRSRSLLMQERIFHEWVLARTEAMLPGADRGAVAAALARGLSDRAPEQRLRCARLARAGFAAEAAAAAAREAHPGVLAALAEAAPDEALLGHASWPVRAGAIHGAARLGTRAAAGLIVARLGQEPGRRRDDLVDALRRMSGKEIGYDPARWRAWWEGLPPDWRAARGAAETAGLPGPEAKVPGAGSRLDEPQAPGVFSDGPAEFFGVRSWTRAAVYCVQGSASWDGIREEVERSVGTLPEGALFGVVVYDGEPRRFRAGLVEANALNRDALAKWLEGLKPDRGADLCAGLEAALDLACGKGKVPAADTIFLAAITRPPEGTLFEDPRQVMLEITARNALLGLRIHAFGPSGGAQSFYLQHLCAQFGGTHRPLP